MNILIACEESQTVCKAFRKLGHNAFSCDILPQSGGYEEWHIQEDVLKVLDNPAPWTGWFRGWDMVIAFPDCTYLTCSAEWAYKDRSEINKNLDPNKLYGIERKEARKKAIEFAKKIYFSDCDKVSIENPVGVLSSFFRKPDQTIHPYEFGDDASKRTCLWLKGLPKLVKQAASYVQPRYVDGRPRWGNQTDSGQNNLPPSKDRAKLRSKTYNGIADAMALHWGK